MLPGLASGLTQEEYCLSASGLHLFSGRNASRDSPLGLHKKRAAFLLQACFSAEAGMLPGLASGLTEEEVQSFCFLLSRDRKCCLPGFSRLTREEDCLSFSCFHICGDNTEMLSVTRLWAYRGKGHFCFRLSYLQMQYNI
jgi:hypothetical protein